MKNSRKPEGHCANKPMTIDGTTYLTQLSKKYLKRKKWEKPNPNHIISIIPGSVIEINVKEEDEVKRGTLLMVIEAMKMKNYIEMPFDGKIISINIKKQQSVPVNFLMMEINPVTI